jgi:uncharacterized protein (UPF0335 family)
LPAQNGQPSFPILGIMAPRKKTLEELKKEAIAELERRGYDVRGRTPAQIRQMIRRRPSKQKSQQSQPQSSTGEKRG